MSKHNHAVASPFVEKLDVDGRHLFFTADTHFCHTNIIRYCNRPFESVEEMNETLIANWNRVVGPDDTVYHLGDFGMGTALGSNGEPQTLADIAYRLNGQIHLIIGNHDLRPLTDSNYCSRFASLRYQAILEIGQQTIILNHYPMLCYAGAYDKKGLTWQFFGHVHSGPLQSMPDPPAYDLPRLKNLFDTQYDVGVDNNGFAPVSLESIRLVMSTRSQRT